ncbi:heme-binding domain-containing protein [Marinoscillum sp. MHG1-6]|uniref:heme-binding domain-containing protein n=1 Tax=Marinoscillum sp. MHG1-6 TaxID=2959627 RepID=UPI002157ACC1|nr:heme-binding domain-containing protein [Marinoscillum sp. MHG1-6]
MKKIIIYVLVFALVTLVVLQLFPGTKPETTLDNPNDIHKEVLIAPEVSKILRKACYDCHSNETVYPWYGNIAPVSWLVYHDVEEGREELNFSEWIPYSLKKKNHKLEEIAEEVEEGKMPLPIYVSIHPEADLTREERELLINWAKNLKGSAEE